MRPIRVTAGIIIREGRVLAAQRKPSDRLAGLFEFPGGKIEPGETPEACLKRELNEELGLDDVTVIGHYMTVHHQYPFAEIELQIFLCSTSALPTRLDSHELIQWLMPQELLSVEWAPADIPAVEKLAAQLTLEGAIQSAQREK
jgi:8-oxo-dGTP diphosphatase